MTAQELGRIDETRLDRLLDLAGPETGAELLARLDEDLARIDSALAWAIALDDRTTIRAETHILIAVAGAVGGPAVSDNARALNIAAHQTDAALPPTLITTITQDMLALRSLVARRRAG